MTSLRRSESDRRVVPRERPLSFHESQLSGGLLKHASSSDGFHLLENQSQLSIADRAKHYNQFIQNSAPLAPANRSASHRELRPFKMSGDFVDAFNFASGAQSHHRYHSRSNADVTNPGEVFSGGSRQPVPPVRSDSRYHPMLPGWQQQHQQHQQQDRTMLKSQPNLGQGPSQNGVAEHQKNPVPNDSISSQQYSGPRQGSNKNRDQSNQPPYNGQTQAYRGQYQPRIYTNNNTVSQPLLKSKPAFGPVVNGNDNFKRRMQRAQAGDSVSQNEQPTERHSVRSMIGLFDQPEKTSSYNPANNKGPVDSITNQTGPIKNTYRDIERNRSSSTQQDASNHTRNPSNPDHLNSSRKGSQRGDTQVVHLAHIVQIGTPSKPGPQFSDAQTSPIPISPPSETPGYKQESPPVLVASAATFTGPPRPKLAIVTNSSSSSVLSCDVFTTPETSDAPVFEMVSPDYQSYHTNETPTVTGPNRSQPPRTLALPKQRTTGDEEASEYQSMEDLRGKNNGEPENCYEPIFSVPPASDQTTHKNGSQTNISTPRGQQQARVEPMPQEFDRPNTPESQSYSSQLRQASHFTLRQTSLENKSPEQIAHRQRASIYSSSPTRHQTDHYRSEGNMLHHESTTQRANRTESYRQNNRPKNVHRSSSYRDMHKSSSAIPSPDSKADIRNRLVDYVKRKAGDTERCYTDTSESRENSYNAQHHNAASPLSGHPQRPFQRISSEGHFRKSSMDRTSSVNHSAHRPNPEYLRSPLSETSQRGIPRHSSDSVHSNYMNSWEGFSGHRNTSNSSSDQSPLSPHSANLDGTPRVKKPLKIAEVTPFSRSKKDRSQRNDTNSSNSSAGSSGLKPMKVPVQHSEPEGPPLPPRNYKLEDLDKRITKPHVQTLTTPTHSHSRSIPGAHRVDHVVEQLKPYENIKADSQLEVSSRNDDDRYDQDYTKQLRKFSENAYKAQRGPSFSSVSHHSPTTSSLNSIHSPINQSNYQYTPQTHPQETNMDDFVNEQPVPVPRKPQHHRERHDVSPPLPPKTDVAAFQSMREDRMNGRRSMPTSRYEPRLEPTGSVTTLREDDVIPLRENSVSKSPFINADPKMQAIVGPQVPPRTPPSERKSYHQAPSKRYGDVTSIRATPAPSSFHSNSNINSITVSTNLNTAISPGEDTTVISAPPDAINKVMRRRSITKSERKHSDTASRRSSKHEEDIRRISRETIRSSSSQDEITPTRLQSRSKSSSIDDLMAECDFPSRPSPPYRRIGLRETEFSADSDVPIPTGRKQAIDGAPVPYARYNRSVNSERSLGSSIENLSGSHSRQSSAELLEINSLPKSSPVPARRSSPANMLRASPQELISSTSPPTVRPAPRRSFGDAVLESTTVSRRSTPSPSSSGSRTGKTSPMFQKISDEFVEALREKGIDIKDKQTCVSDEAKVSNNLDNQSRPKEESKPVEIRAPQKMTMRHIRQKSSDEILLDDQVESLSRCIKDEDVTNVFNGPSKAPKDYIPGLFDEILTKDVPRRSRTSMDSTSPCHSKQSSAGDDLKSDASKLTDSASKKEELLMVLRKKLCVLEQDQRFRQSELEDNSLQGEQVLTLVKTQCNHKEVDKYTSYVEQIEGVTRLLLKLSRRLAKADNALLNVSSSATDDEKKSLEQKRNHLLSQYNDAKQIKESIDVTKPTIISTLEDRLSTADYHLYDTFISIRLKLTVELNDLEDQIMSCNEQISAIAAIS